MSSKTVKEFSEIIGWDKKKLDNKLRYQKQKNGLELGTFSGGVRHLSDSDQKAICELLGIPFFRHFSGDSGAMSEKVSEKVPEIALLREQIGALKSDKDFLQKQNSDLLNANSEMRILLKQAQDHSEKLQLDLHREQTRGFWSRLFGRNS